MKEGERKKTAGLLDPTEGLVINEVVNSGEVTGDSGAADPAENTTGAEGKEAGSAEQTPAAEPGSKEGKQTKSQKIVRKKEQLLPRKRKAKQRNCC